MKKLFLIDGHSLIFKMYYAFLRRPMINSKGEDTSILFGFTKYILELIGKENPTHLAIAFDPPGKTFRHELFHDYKGTRSATPQPVIDALGPLVDICRALRIPVLMEPGYEADDVIGSFATSEAENGFEVYMVTVDKDYGQLLGERIFQYKPGKSGNENEIITAEMLCRKYGIDNPAQFIDILTVWGDTSDNIPGIKGIGEVGAAKLISQFGSIEGIYANLDKLKPKQKEAFEEARDRIGLSRKLVEIKRDLPVNVPEKELETSLEYGSETKKIFDRYEFGSLVKYFPADMSQEPGPSVTRETIECNPSPLETVVSEASKSGHVAVSAKDGKIVIAAGEKTKYVSEVNFPLKDKDDTYILLGKIFSDPGITKTGFDMKTACKLLMAENIRIGGEIRDIEIMHYLSDPEMSHKVEMIIQGCTGKKISDYTLSGFGAPAQDNGEAPDLFNQKTEEADISSMAAETVLSEKAGKVLSEKLLKDGMSNLYNDIEEPLIEVLADMERQGVKVDIGQLQQYRRELEKEMLAIESEVREIAGEPSLNLSSPKQLGVVLYEKMNLNPKINANGKNNYPTDEETLNGLLDKSPIIQKILDFRGLKKLISTYIDPLPALMGTDGKLHTTFNQALTATGRLSSSRPNLQNIPVRTDKGKEIRKAFVPCRPDGYILSADYSQIELRIMAHISCDRHLVEAFRNGGDIHAMTAAKIFKTDPGSVTKEQRRRAKTANFGIMYGISAFGLSQRLRIPRSESKELIEEYFANFKGVEAYIKDCIAMAREKGYVETLFGRRRYLPDINSKNNTVRSLAERNAINAPIQGTAADIIKLAMVRIFRRMEREGFESRMILQVHDELVFDTAAHEAERLAALVKEEMEGVAKLSVPLTVECNWASNWLDAH